MIQAAFNAKLCLYIKSMENGLHNSNKVVLWFSEGKKNYSETIDYFMIAWKK